jgi:hypothetical protein
MCHISEAPTALLLAAALVMAALFIVAAPVAAAETIVCEGVLGNSGGQGADLVRMGDVKAVRGMGVVCDRYQSLWDRAGDGVLNRYALDGRLLAQYAIAKGTDGRDQLTLVGDVLVLQVAGKLYTLSIDAPAGSAAKPMKRDSACISFGSVGGRFASATKEAVFLVAAATGEAQQVLDLKDAEAIEFGPDGAIYALSKGQVRKFVGGKEVTDGWPRPGPGERPQLLDGAWYGNAWHGTIRRFSASLEPAPGVVLGGASGSFIGHLDQNADVSNGRGLAHIGPNLFAVSGIGGIPQLLEWDGQKQQMRIIRRLGAVPAAGGIGLDRDGRIWWFAGVWQWTDRPDAPLDQGVSPLEFPGVAQVVMLPGDAMVAPCWMWGKPTFVHGKLSTEVLTERIESACALKTGMIGTAVYADRGKLVLMTIDRGGAGQAFFIDAAGKYQGEAGPVALKTMPPAKEFTSLAMKEDGTLLAAADGYVIEIARDGKDWKESRRWNSWGAGAAEKFGGRIFIAADAGRLWVADRERQRVIAFDMASGKPVGTFGTVDKKGTDLDALELPETIAARGQRAVVFDSENQRLMKLRLK